MVSEHVPQHRGIRFRWMRALRWLGELVWVAEENYVLSARGDGERIRKRELSGLVDKQNINLVLQLRAGKEPRRSADDIQPRLERARHCLRLESLDPGVMRPFIAT